MGMFENLDNRDALRVVHEIVGIFKVYNVNAEDSIRLLDNLSMALKLAGEVGRITAEAKP